MNRKILLRFDDICQTMDWEQWNKAKELMDKEGVVALLGVIPDCKDPELMINEPREDYWFYLRELQNQGYKIAMHGYNHSFVIKADGLITKNKISEFAGLPFDTQLQKIKEGKDILNSHGIFTDVFFAPAHSYDYNTLRALSCCGFKYVSDGLSCKPYYVYGIELLPCKSGGIPRISKKYGYVTAVVHAHEWVKNDKKDDWVKFVKLIQEHSSEIVSFDDYIKRTKGLWLVQRFNEILCLYVNLYLKPVIKRIMYKCLSLINNKE